MPSSLVKMYQLTYKMYHTFVNISARKFWQVYDCSLLMLSKEGGDDIMLKYTYGH